MKIVTWAAVAVTALFVLMNVGAAIQSDVATGYRVAAGFLAIVGTAAALGLAADRSWARAAVVAVGALNVAAAVVGLFTEQEGAVIGLVVGGLGVVLGALANGGARRRAAV